MDKMYFRTLSKAVNYYAAQGYDHAFDFSNPRMEPTGWCIVETHRFEGFTDPSDNSILYVLEKNNGLDKGMIIDCYGAGRDARICKFLEAVERDFPSWMILPEAQIPYGQHTESIQLAN